VPVPKISARKEHADFRSISITPVLLRILERIIVNQFIYPAILTSHRIVCDGQAMVQEVKVVRDILLPVRSFLADSE